MRCGLWPSFETPASQAPQDEVRIELLSRKITMKPVVLSLGAFPPATVQTLAERFEYHHYTVHPLPEGTLSAELKGRIRGIATEANRGATRALIEQLPKLEIISCFGVGVDAIDLAAARERNIPVTNTPGILADECADLAIGMMLASARQIVFADGFVRSGAWLKGPPSPNAPRRSG
jgi:lactate dehydrogenase-like 2-hydroxyacid dehydrogenase